MIPRRILFITENVTLAQVVRLATLANGLAASRFEVHFACAAFEPGIFRQATFTRWHLPSVDGARSLRRAEQGRRVYDEKTLERYVERDLALFAKVEPDLVVGDFRLSLCVSAPCAGVPYAALINAYWSPYAIRDRFPLPDHPLVDLFGTALAARVFPRVAPFAFERFAAPVNALRRRYGLARVGGLLEVLSSGDYVLYPDIPELCPTAAPATHHYLGAVQWAPDAPIGGRIAELIHGSKPFVYVTLGSSGRVQLLGRVLSGLSGLGLSILVATAGRAPAAELATLPDVYVTDFLPGHLAARSARFVVSNGGSSTGYQALAEAKPVLGIPSNLDHYLASAAIERAGAGLSVRGGSLTSDQVRAAAETLLTRPEPHERARALARAFGRFDCHQRFQRFLAEPSARRYDHAVHP